jgi:hypothetical protein
MTHESDRPDPEEHGRQLDEDAAWRAIVDNYGDQPDFPDLDLPDPDDAPDTPQAAPAAPAFPSLERRWEDPLQSEASWEDEGHFTPPEPPPLPTVEPQRRLAWAGLFGAPLVMLVAVVLGWTMPGWLGFLLVAGFLGGFGFLVATMPRSRSEDGDGDDGAVV